MAPPAAKAPDVGFVLDGKSPVPGTLNARWIFTDVHAGSWRVDDELEAAGVGVETGDGLALGWRRTEPSGG